MQIQLNNNGSSTAPVGISRAQLGDRIQTSFRSLPGRVMTMTLDTEVSVDCANELLSQASPAWVLLPPKSKEQ